MDVSLIADAIDGAGIDASAGTLVNAAIGKQSMWIPATAMYPTATAGCAEIASVKTTASNYLKLKKSSYVFNADEVAKNILKTNKEIQKELINNFGKAILKNKKIDSWRLANIAFQNKKTWIDKHIIMCYNKLKQLGLDIPQDY